MNRVAFIDTNVPIYAAGREHPYKVPCVRVLTMVAQHPLVFVTSVEVLQEIVHYYHASRRWELGREVLRSFSEIMHERIEPVYEWDIHFAASLAELQPRISTRDLLHAAVMHRLESDHIISADTDFDRLPEITRLDPSKVEEWSNALTFGESDQQL
jgi:predicted nucleic acid-binding protein